MFCLFSEVLKEMCYHNTILTVEKLPLNGDISYIIIPQRWLPFCFDMHSVCDAMKWSLLVKST